MHTTWLPMLTWYTRMNENLVDTLHVVHSGLVYQMQTLAAQQPNNSQEQQSQQHSLFCVAIYIAVIAPLYVDLPVMVTWSKLGESGKDKQWARRANPEANLSNYVIISKAFWYCLFHITPCQQTKMGSATDQKLSLLRDDLAGVVWMPSLTMTKVSRFKV